MATAAALPSKGRCHLRACTSVINQNNAQEAQGSDVEARDQDRCQRYFICRTESEESDTAQDTKFKCVGYG